ncbi:MAG: ABC transporter ATP-binding protein [Thermodesulfobacteriota bacterium]
MKSTLQNFRPLLECLQQNRWGLLIGMACLLAVDFLQLLIPLVIKEAVDRLTARAATPGLLLKYALLILSIALTMAALRYVWRHFLFGFSRKVERALRERLYTHLQSLSPSFYQRTKTGDLMARSVNDVNAVRMATGMGLVMLTDGLILGIAAVAFMVYISLQLTVISLLPAPVLIYLTMILTRRMSSGYERVQGVFSDLTERVREAFAGIRVLKAYCRESWAGEAVAREGERYVSENVELARTIGLFFPLIAVFTNLGLAIVIWLGGRLTILGNISTGDFVAFISYLNLLTWPMMAIGWVTNLLQRGAASMRRINRILDETPEIHDSTSPRPMTGLRGGIEFRGLNLRHPGRSREAVRDIRLAIAKGSKVALVGRVGSGKTTLLHAVPRLVDVPRATLFLDGVDVNDVPLKALRENIGFATQETMIFSDTIRGNVLFGRSGIPEETLLEALKTVQFYEEVMDLEKGMDTLLGERGLTLSGGQRQRLCIARAILTRPPILILDDALSMVDTRTEERILTRILESRNGKTTLMVSHRVSTIGRADLVVVLEKGSVVETGDHWTLLERGQEYARLYERQMLAQELDMAVPDA